MLGQQLARSGGLMVCARLLSRVIDLCAMLILARLLTPADFGLAAIAMTIVTLLEAALEMPLSQALVKLPQIKAHHLDTAFTISLMRGLLLCIFCTSIAIPFSRWYGHPALVPLIQVLSIAPASRGMQNPRLAEYAKILNFKYEFYFELTGKSLAFLSAGSFAYFTRSYWSIALCTVISPVTMALLSYTFIPYRPRLSLRDWRVFSSFLGWISLSQIASAINFQSEQLLLGKLMPASKLGLFFTANNVTFIAVNAVFGPVLRPLLSAFTLIRDDKARLREAYQSAASAIVALGLPMLVGQAAVARPLVAVLFGPKWANAATLLEWLSISIIPYLFGLLLTPLGMALEQTREISTRNLVQLFVKLPLLIIGVIQYGFAGVIFARMVSETVTGLSCMISVRKLLGLSLLEQVRVNSRAIISCLIMFAAVHVLDAALYFPGGVAFQLLRLVLLTSTGFVTYVGSMLLLWCLAGRPHGVESSVLRLLRGLGRHGTTEALSALDAPLSKKARF